jgi:hypothetical protein
VKEAERIGRNKGICGRERKAFFGQYTYKIPSGQGQAGQDGSQMDTNRMKIRR